MFGVWIKCRFSPYALTACHAWSSAMMNRMFGRAGAAIATAGKSSPARI